MFVVNVNIFFGLCEKWQLIRVATFLVYIQGKTERPSKKRSKMGNNTEL